MSPMIATITTMKKLRDDTPQSHVHVLYTATCQIRQLLTKGISMCSRKQ